ncbi:MAG TPA: DUF4062 domain-containing protein [Nitrososphaerales archaeon]
MSIVGRTPQGLTVFVSSSIKEFENERVRLEKEIEEIGFLTPIILERRGARPGSVNNESLTGARESDIFVGIFGTSFSDLTAKEFKQAFTTKKPCFIYVLKAKGRDPNLERFIIEEVQPHLKYQEFDTTSKLILHIRNDLSIFLGDVLRMGIDVWVKDSGKRTPEEIIRDRFSDNIAHDNEIITVGAPWQEILKPIITKQLPKAPQWLRILAVLSKGSSSMKSLTRETGIYGSVLWFRMKALQSSGLIIPQQKMNKIVYSITEEGVTVLRKRYPKLNNVDESSA